MKLTNHTRVLNELGNSWITAKVYNEMYAISLLDTKSNSCYIEKSKDYQAFNRPCYKIITRSTLFIYLFEILKTLTMSHTFTRKGAEVIKCLNTTK